MKRNVWRQRLFATTAIVLPLLTIAAPVSNCLSEPSCGPVPGKSDIYSDLQTIEPPWPGNTKGAVLNTTTGHPGEDDILFQNLLAAEWIIFSFYQQGVETFDKSAFTSAGFADTTYDRIREIRDNEAGHLRIFQDQNSSASVKPGPCEYKFPYTDATSYLALQTAIEVSSMAFLTGLELEAKLTFSRGVLVAIAATESRHNTWSLIDNWDADPFAGPSDTFFPYANQILDFTNAWVIKGSCPSENPVYPFPSQGLPALSVNPETTKSIAPGSTLTFSTSGGEKPLQLDNQQNYYAVFFHGVLNISVPLDTATMSATVPASLEPKGIYEVVLATAEGAPEKESVVAGPLVLLELPEQLGLQLLG